MRPKTVDVDTFRVADPAKAFESFTSLLKTVVHADPAAVDAAMKRDAEANQAKREKGK